MVFLEILGVTIVGFVPLTAPHQISQFIIMLLCGMQYNTFRQAEGIGMATTFCTNHLRMLGVSLAQTLFRRSKHPEAAGKAGAHVIMIGCFVVGSVVSALLCSLCGQYTVLLALIPLVVLFADLLHADLTKEKEKLNVRPKGHE